MTVTDELRVKTDEELKLLAERSYKLLEERAKEKKRAAIDEIKQIAAAHDLRVDVRVKPPRRRRKKKAVADFADIPDTRDNADE